MFRKQIKLKPVKRNCVFCNENKEPDYKNTDELRSYVTEKGKVIGKARTGICAKHQHRLDQQIKRARHLATLPFVAGI